jgi:TRAP-type C4-dicarboxylate transport system permease small subunit
MNQSESNPFTNLLSPAVRAVLYAVLSLAALVFSIFQAADGDWKLFVGSLLTALLTLVAASNASPTPTS